MQTILTQIVGTATLQLLQFLPGEKATYFLVHASETFPEEEALEDQCVTVGGRFDDLAEAAAHFKACVVLFGNGGV